MKHAFLLIPVMGEASLACQWARCASLSVPMGTRPWKELAKPWIRGSMVMAMDSIRALAAGTEDPCEEEESWGGLPLSAALAQGECEY